MNSDDEVFDEIDKISHSEFIDERDTVQRRAQQMAAQTYIMQNGGSNE